jgi:hypothetical protein
MTLDDEPTLGDESLIGPALHPQGSLFYLGRHDQSPEARPSSYVQPPLMDPRCYYQTWYRALPISRPRLPPGNVRSWPQFYFVGNFYGFLHMLPYLDQGYNSLQHWPPVDATPNLYRQDGTNTARLRHAYWPELGK